LFKITYQASKNSADTKFGCGINLLQELEVASPKGIS